MTNKEKKLEKTAYAMDGVMVNLKDMARCIQNVAEEILSAQMPRLDEEMAEFLDNEIKAMAQYTQDLKDAKEILAELQEEYKAGHR